MGWPEDWCKYEIPKEESVMTKEKAYSMDWQKVKDFETLRTICVTLGLTLTMSATEDEMAGKLAPIAQYFQKEQS